MIRQFIPAACWIIFVTFAAVLCMYVLGPGLNLDHSRLLTRHTTRLHLSELEAAGIKQIDVTSSFMMGAESPRLYVQVQGIGTIDLRSKEVPDKWTRTTILHCPSWSHAILCGAIGHRGYMVLGEFDVQQWTPDEARAYIDQLVRAGLNAVGQYRAAETKWKTAEAQEVHQ